MRNFELKGLTIERNFVALFCCVCGFFAVVGDARADTRRPPKTAFSATNVFADRDFSPQSFFTGKIVDVSAPVEVTKTQTSDEAQETGAEDNSLQASQRKSAPLIYVQDQDPAKNIVPPDQDEPLRLNKEAPSSFVAMTMAHRNGDDESAFAYARQYVRYLKNVAFQVRELMQLIGRAMIEEGAITEDDWDGVEQLATQAYSSGKKGDPFTVTHEDALKRIKPDQKGQVELYYFFSISCKPCMEMSAHIERLWQISKKDENIKLIALTLEATPVSWVQSYRDYTGLSMPIREGGAVARAFDIAMVPTVVAVAPNGGVAYRRTGLMPFEHLYEFVRTVAGRPKELSEDAIKVAQSPIGAREKLLTKRGLKITGVKNVNADSNLQMQVGRRSEDQADKEQDTLERF